MTKWLIGGTYETFITKVRIQVWFTTVGKSFEAIKSYILLNKWKMQNLLNTNDGKLRLIHYR